METVKFETTDELLRAMFAMRLRARAEELSKSGMPWKKGFGSAEFHREDVLKEIRDTLYWLDGYVLPV